MNAPFLPHSVMACPLVLPLDIIEVTYLLPTPDSFPMSTTNLVASHAYSFMCRTKDITHFQTAVHTSPIDATHHMVTLHPTIYKMFKFVPRSLVPLKNMWYDKVLRQKMKACYLGSLVVLSRSKGGTYIICELNSSVHHHSNAAFHLIPYLAHTHITRPSLDSTSMF